MLKPFRQKIQSLNKTQQNILTIILILINVFIVIFWVNFWVNLQKKKVISLPPPESKEELIIKEQLQEFEQLRQEAGAQPPTKEQIQKQLKELERLRSQ